MQSEFTVEGMTCSHCVNAVTSEVSAVDGVTVVSVELEGGRLVVDSEAAPDVEAIAAAVDEAGYTLVTA